MTDIEDVMDRVEDIVGDLLIISDTLDKGVSAMDAMTDAIDDMKLSNEEERELAKTMVRFMLKLINDTTSKLDEIKKDIEDVNKELETMG
jgi:methyl-accepting chemotaxis protein